MNNRSFEILTNSLLQQYSEQVTTDYLLQFETLEESELSIDTFSFYTSVAAVFSSKIEGENIDLDSYVKYKRFGIGFLPDYTRKINDLYNAYQFAKTATLNQKNIEAAHQILTKHILTKNQQGKIRKSNMYVTTEDGRTEYVATSPSSLKAELEKLYYDLDILLQSQLIV